MPLRAKTKLACEIAGIEPQKFNEAVSQGLYKCAPETKPGSARIFEIDDIVALIVYGVWVNNWKATSERASEIACMVRRLMTEDGRPITLYPEPDGSVSRRPYQYDVDGERQIGTRENQLVTVTFNIAQLRERVQAALEWEDDNRVVGE